VTGVYIQCVHYLEPVQRSEDGCDVRRFRSFELDWVSEFVDWVGLDIAKWTMSNSGLESLGSLSFHHVSELVHVNNRDNVNLYNYLNRIYSRQGNIALMDSAINIQYK